MRPSRPESGSTAVTKRHEMSPDPGPAPRRNATSGGSENIPSTPVVNISELEDLISAVDKPRIIGEPPDNVNGLLRPSDDGTPGGRSATSDRESATTFQTIDDMGHQDWIESLKYHDESVNVLGESDDTHGSPVDVELDSIWATLLAARVKPAIDPTERQTFIPLGRLRAILSPINVDKLLRQKFSEEAVGRFKNAVYEKEAENHYRPKRLKIMGTLLLIQCLECLDDFIQAEIEDDRLPLGLKLDSKILRPRLFDRHGEELTSLSNCNWTYNQAEFFVLKQMLLCSLFCSIKDDGGLVDHFRLPGDFVLPFQNCKDPVVLFGGFGKITKVKIEPSHLWYRGRFQKPAYFAVKTIHHDLVDHPSEADSLARRLVIREPKDRDHLHQLLFSFRRTDFYHLVFEWADGDLTDLWKNILPQYKPSEHDHVCWFFRQCLGLLRSLNSLHNLHSSYTAMSREQMVHVIYAERHGRHSDIKPQNILWFKNYRDKRDHLVIADLGLTQFNTTKSKSRVPWADARGYTQTYKAPDGDVDRYIGTGYDIWALGCVFLEHASVFLRGDGTCIDEFSYKRLTEDQKYPWSQNYSSDTFYYLVQENPYGGTDADSMTTSQGQYQAEVKNTVREWIKDLQIHKLCSAAMNDFLNIIGQEMLVADQNKRSDGPMVIQSLQNISRRCNNDVGYACFPQAGALEEGKKTAVDSGHHREDNATARLSQDLAGISGGQENPDASLELPSGGEKSNNYDETPSMNGLDLSMESWGYRVGSPGLTTHASSSSPPSTTSSTHISTQSLPLQTIQTSGLGGIDSPHQQSSPTSELIQRFKSLSINEEMT